MGAPEGAANAADNRKTLNNTAATVANWRQCSVAPCGVAPTAVPAPPNDAFAAATTVSSFPAQFTATTTGATTEAGEPTTLNCAGTTKIIGKTVWYTFTAPGTANLTIDTLGSNYDTILAVYSGSAIGGLTQVACNDDFIASSTQSRVNVALAAGVTYKVQVGGFVGNTGINAGNLVLNFGSVPLSPTPVATCSPRPPVTVTSTPIGGGQLQVSVAPSGNARVLALQFGTVTNGLIDVAGQTNVTGGTTVNMPPETLSATFVVRRATAGVATHVSLTVVDGCGAWPTFVGGGPAAF
jgi:hypothetical protein